MQARLEPADVRGFRFAGVSAGLKPSGASDLGLIVADAPVAAVGAFTSNRVKAAPVIVAQERLRARRLSAIVVNSGSANCFTGRAGMKLALASCEAAARALGCRPELVVPCSTGVIGHLYDLDKYRDGVIAAAAELGADRMGDFARAIMTTDTRPKVAAVRVRLGGKEVTVAGAAKGAAMISPKMATMLAFILTDAAVGAPALRTALARGLPNSFNAITVDGDMSTNDTVILMASGAAANRAAAGADLNRFHDAVGAVAAALARELIADAEGATKLVAVEVRGARTEADAARVARQIANSPLVKTAFFGCDPNVGRIICAAGASAVAFDPDRLELSVGGVKIAARGAILTQGLEAAAARMRERDLTVRLDLKLGKSAATILTSDLSPDYVRLNSEYTT